jgi:hypothetical protein
MRAAMRSAPLRASFVSLLSMTATMLSLGSGKFGGEPALFRADRRIVGDQDLILDLDLHRRHGKDEGRDSEGHPGGDDDQPVAETETRHPREDIRPEARLGFFSRLRLTVLPGHGTWRLSGHDWLIPINESHSPTGSCYSLCIVRAIPWTEFPTGKGG